MKKNMKIRKRFVCYALTVTILAGIPETVFASQPGNEEPPDLSTAQETLPSSEKDVGGLANDVPVALDGNYEIRFADNRTEYTYSGFPITPSVKVYPKKSENGNTLEPLPDSCYDVSYENNEAASTENNPAKVTVTAKTDPGCGYTGQLTANFTISKADLANCTVTLSQASYVYDGTAKQPDITVMLDKYSLQKGTDFTYSYADNVNAGTAKAVVNAAGNNFTGVRKINFVITPAAPNLPAPAAPTPSAPAVTNPAVQTSQQVSQNGLLAPVIKSASYSAKGKKKITIKWSKVKRAKGYYIYRSTSENGTYKKIKNIKSGKTLSYKNTGIKSQKTYYYKVQAYKTVKKNRKTGPFSAARACSTGGTGVDVASSGYTLYVNKKTNVVTVYDEKGTPIKSFICSAGKATPVGTFYTKAKYRWHSLMGNCYGQWDTRIVGGVLFHSVFYLRKNNNHTLSVNAYNKLGTTASHGCVRLTARDAKWIYDNCKLKTKVVIIKNSSKGPLGKPKACKLPKWHTWDPTDPNCRSKCQAKGCH